MYLLTISSCSIFPLLVFYEQFVVLPSLKTFGECVNWSYIVCVLCILWVELISHGFVLSLGESPSSSASDVDNLNNPATMDKVALTKGANSPQVTGNHVIPSRNRPNFVRLLNFVSIWRHFFSLKCKCRKSIRKGEQM